MLDDLLRRTTLLTIAAAIAVEYGLLQVGQGAAALVLSVFTEREGSFAASGGTLSLDVAGRTLEFAQLVGGLVTLAVVLAVVAFALRGRPGD